MSDLRRDSITGRWVIVNTDEPAMPHEYEHEDTHAWRTGACPFCYGNESSTPPEIIAIREPGTAANTPGWQVRVIPNKFPALQIEGALDRRPMGLYDMSNGVGAHEIVVDTAYHHKDFSDLLDSEVTNILNIYAQRTLDLEKDRRFKYILIFKNHGSSAGASAEHPHSQIIALPMVPKNVKEELYGAQKYFDYRERCVFCDMIHQEIEDQQRIVAENKNFIMFCPFVSRFPFEVWIIPRKHTSFFCQTPYEQMPDLAVLLRSLISKVKKVFGNPAYNFIVHSAPVNSDANSTDSYHWHLEFIPKLTRVAGFEWGTGFYLVPTPPEVAAKLLREA